MKHIWFINDSKFTLGEGYVENFYKQFNDAFIYQDENQLIPVDRVSIENIFDNQETAINMYKGMIGIERVKVHNKIEELKRYDEELFEKLLKI